MRSVLTVAVLLPLLAAGATPSLETLRGQVSALRYADAAKTAAALLELEGLSTGEAAEVFFQTGLVRAALKDASGARAAFMRALLLDPALRLPGKMSPRVATPFSEAKAWAQQHGPLTLVTESSRAGGTDAWAVLCEPVKDELGLVGEVSLSVDEDGATRTLSGRPVATTRVDGRGARVEVRWRLLSAKRWVLAEGALQLPLFTPAPVTPTVITEPSAPVMKPPRPSIARQVGIGFAAVGATGVIVGAISLASAGTRAAEARAAKDPAVLHGALESGRIEQTVGTVAVPVGAIVVVGGVALILASMLSPSPTTSVAVAPVPGGGVAVLSGVFP